MRMDSSATNTLTLSTDLFQTPRWQRWAFVFAVWTIPAVVALSYYYLNAAVTQAEQGWTYGLVSTLPNWYMWAVFTPAIIYLGRRFPVTKGNRLRNIVGIHLPMLLILLLVHSMINLTLYRVTGIHDTMNLALLEAHFNFRVHANVASYLAVLGFFYTFDYYRRSQLNERHMAILELQLAQAKLRALKMHSNPQCLYNTLHSVAALVRKEENKTAIKMLGRLGEFLRLALENKGVQEITLAEELDFLDRYLGIEKVRFQDRLTIIKNVNQQLLDSYVPNLLLQPLVENAIHHGIAPHADGGRIEVHAALEGDMLVLKIRDDGPGLQETNQARRGVGLSNTAERLERLYGDNQRLDLYNAETGGLVVHIELPYHTEPVLRNHLLGDL